MKLFGLYEHDNVPALEANHRTFCEINGIVYARHRVRNYYEKFRLIYHLMEENPGELLFFIDSESYFTTFSFHFSLERELLLQQKDGDILHNFIVLRSTHKVRKTFKEYILPASSYQMVVRSRWEFSHPFPPVPEIPAHLLVSYPHRENGVFLNVDGFANHDNTEVLVRRIHLGKFQFPSFANLLCDYKPATYPVSDIPFAVINPGQRHALITLYTKEFERLGSISEHNIANYCRENEITFYVYRRIPEPLQGLSGTWTKPYLLLKHMEQHDYTGWIDSDILITPGYRMDFSGDIRVYNDPGEWPFNAGFMIYKNNSRNKDLLNGVIKRCEQLDRRDSTYIHGSDQLYFNQEYKAQYPDLLPLSNLETNCLPGFHLPDSSGHLIHFMGIRLPIRAALMDVIQQGIEISAHPSISSPSCSSLKS